MRLYHEDGLRGFVFHDPLFGRSAVLSDRRGEGLGHPATRHSPAPAGLQQTILIPSFPLKEKVQRRRIILSMHKRNYLKTERHTRSDRNRKLLLGAAILLAVYLLASFIVGEMGLIKYFRMKAQHNGLVRDIASLKQDNARLTRSVNALRTDPDLLEQLARDKLGLARPGEIVYYYADPGEQGAVNHR